jgi:hypothetical protein
MASEMEKRVGAAISAAERSWSPASNASRELTMARAAIQAMRVSPETLPGVMADYMRAALATTRDVQVGTLVSWLVNTVVDAALVESPETEVADSAGAMRG